MNVNECELMIHRRTFVDDRYGVGEALDEQAFGLPLVGRGKHLIFLGNQEEGKTGRGPCAKSRVPKRLCSARPKINLNSNLIKLAKPIDFYLSRKLGWYIKQQLTGCF